MRVRYVPKQSVACCAWAKMNHQIVLDSPKRLSKSLRRGKGAKTFERSCSNPLASKEDRNFAMKKVTKRHEVLLKKRGSS